MTEQCELVENTWGYVVTVSVFVLEDAPRAAALLADVERDAVENALIAGYEVQPGTPIELTVEEPTELDVAVAATVDYQEPGDEFFGADPEVIAAESARRAAAARAMRRIRVRLQVQASPEQAQLRQLTGEAASILMREGLETLALTDAADVVCGSPSRRHEFGRAAALLRTGRIQQAECQACHREVTRTELLRQSELEAAGVAWWEDDSRE